MANEPSRIDTFGSPHLEKGHSFQWVLPLSLASVRWAGLRSSMHFGIYYIVENPFAIIVRHAASFPIYCATSFEIPITQSEANT